MKEPSGPSFPNYDHGRPSELSSSATSSKDTDLKAALSAVFAEHKLEVPQELQSFLQPQPGDMIQSDQKILNAKRKLVGKVDRLTKALSRKQEQWQSFRTQLREHLCKEQARYDSDISEIMAAIDTTQAQLNRLMDGKDPEIVDMETQEHTEKPLEEMLGVDAPQAGTTKEPVQTQQMTDTTAEQLRLAHAHQQQMAQQLQELQQQMIYMTSAMMPPNVNSPSTMPKPGASQTPFTPMRRSTLPKGPYAKVEEPPKANAPEENKLPWDIEEISD